MTGSSRSIRGFGKRSARGFSLIEAMMASVIMLIGMLGLAGLQVVGMRANNLGKRMAQASLLGQDLAQNMQLWAYTDTRLTPKNQVALYTDTNAAAIAQYWNLTNAQTPTTSTGTTLTFDYSDAPATAWVTVADALVNPPVTTPTTPKYEGVMTPNDPSLASGEQNVFTRYWNVFSIDLSGTGTAQGKLVQIVVRWKEPNFGYRSVTHSYFKYDPTEFNQ